eukprot:UN04921
MVVNHKTNINLLQIHKVRFKHQNIQRKSMTFIHKTQTLSFHYRPPDLLHLQHLENHAPEFQSSFQCDERI